MTFPKRHPQINWCVNKELFLQLHECCLYFFFSSQIGFYKTAVEYVDHWQNDNTLSVRASVDTGPRDRQGAAPSPALLWSPAGPGRPSPSPGSGFSLPSWANLLQADWRRAAPGLLRLPRDHRSFVSRGRRPGTAGRARRAARSPARRTPGGGTRAGPGHRGAEAEPGRRRGDQGRRPGIRSAARAPAGRPHRAGSALRRQHRGAGARGPRPGMSCLRWECRSGPRQAALPAAIMYVRVAVLPPSGSRTCHAPWLRPPAHRAPLGPAGPSTSWRWGTRATRSTRITGRRGSSAPTWGEARWFRGTRAACCWTRPARSRDRCSPSTRPVHSGTSSWWCTTVPSG